MSHFKSMRRSPTVFGSVRVSAPITAITAIVFVASLAFWILPVTPALAGPKTQAGPYAVEVVTEPVVIPVGKVGLQVKITDRATGKPVEGATVRAITKMPTMDMGEREQPGTPEAGVAGRYRVPAQFAMEGGYESTIRITGPLGAATARIPLQTGQNTAATSAAPVVSPILATALIGVLLLAVFTLYRMKRTGQRVAWAGILNRQVLGGVLLLGIIAAGAAWAVSHLRRPGALTPVEAQAMDMSYLPPPPGFMPVELATVTRGPVTSTVQYTGTAVGFVEQDVYPRGTGTLVYLPLYAGDTVRKGQVVARLDTSQTAPQLAQQQAAAGMAREGVSVARAEVQQAKAEVEQAHAELAGKEGGLAEAKAEVEAATEERANADASLASARAQAEDAAAQVVAAEADRTYWRAQIERSAALLKAGAVSGEEYQRDRAQAEAAEAKVKQAQARVAQMAADVSAAQAGRRKGDAQIAAARAKVQMARSELDAHFAHVSAAGAAVTTAERRVAQAQSGATQAAAVLQGAKATQGYAEIRAETDGVVLQRIVSPGVLVAPGQAIMRIARISPIRLQASVAEADLLRIRAGSAVMVKGRSDDGRKPIAARVTSISPSIDSAARTTIVEAVVPNPDRRFLPGQYVVMNIATSSSSEVLRLPTRAIHYRTPATDAILTTASQPFVWIAEDGGQPGQYAVRRIDVQTGASDGNMTEVVSGVKEGQHVVVTGAADLKDGDTVADAHVADHAADKTAATIETLASPSQTGPTQTARVTVTAKGFEPSSIPLKAGMPARITFTRTSAQTCATEVVFPDYSIRRALPLNQPVVVEFTPKKPGEIGFACGMNMVKGKVVAR